MLTEKKFQNCCKPLKPEIWGGIECTINRVGDVFRDQLKDTGHYERPNDLKEIADLGISMIRYPVLWEKHQPAADGTINWQWIEGQLLELKRCNIKPIVGLVHHGSGPSHTNLFDKNFPTMLASYARKVAEKFPWIEYYTPVNEPLTTARFSGLYGVWYPHRKSSFAFLTMLLNELKATVLAMKEIRKINPAAKLVQTEDLTKVQSTRLLQYQANFENKRRWLTYDLLCGKVNKRHALWKYLISTGITKHQLDFFLKNPCPPDIIGCNYYVTSERYLDENIDQYPERCRGSNGKHCYADIESVRVNKMLGLQELLKEVWERYQIPVAITEVHLHCTREEQMRWLVEAWQACCNLKQQGIDIRALTVWAMLGSYDWNTLITAQNNSYESGVFDVRNNTLRKTALAGIVKALSTEGIYDHPVLAGKGWWHNHTYEDFLNIPGNNNHINPPLLITGKSGTLGNAFARICRLRSIPHVLLSRHDLNICDEQSIEQAINFYKPWAIINAAGFVKVDEAERYADECLKVNAQAAGLLAKICNKKGIRFMTFSSDMVFDGIKRSPYVEGDSVNPVNVYGKSKAMAESMVLNENPASLVIRTSSFFGPWDVYNFAYDVLQKLQQEQLYIASKDVIISPTYVPDLVNAALDMFIDEETGILHITNEGKVSWAEFAGEIASRAGFNKKSILHLPAEEMHFSAQRPLYSVLNSQKGVQLPSIDDAISRYFAEKVV
jgi:dTDP-4-dehydrorhamnose reductase